MTQQKDSEKIDVFVLEKRYAAIVKLYQEGKLTYDEFKLRVPVFNVPFLEELAEMRIKNTKEGWF